MVGDLVDLVEGMEIPADGIVLEASELTADESAMTGETGKIAICFLKKYLKICEKYKNILLKRSTEEKYVE